MSEGSTGLTVAEERTVESVVNEYCNALAEEETEEMLAYEEDFDERNLLATFG